MEIIDKFFDDLQELYKFERGLKNERYLILKENELPALEIKIEANRGIHKKIKNEIIVAGIKPDYISVYLAKFKDALHLIEILIEDRLKDELINSFGDRTFEIVSRFKSLAWTMRMEIQKTITFLKLVLDPEAPERERKNIFERLRQINIELNTPPAETRGFKSNLSDDNLELLFNWLVDNKYLDPNSDKTFFIQAFGGHIIDMNSKNKLNWIDIPITNNSPFNSHTIFQILISLAIINQSDRKSFTLKAKKLLQMLFTNNLGNQTSKFTEFWDSKTERQKLISDYITTLLKP